MEDSCLDRLDQKLCNIIDLAQKFAEKLDEMNAKLDGVFYEEPQKVQLPYPLPPQTSHDPLHQVATSPPHLLRNVVLPIEKLPKDQVGEKNHEEVNGFVFPCMEKSDERSQLFSAKNCKLRHVFHGLSEQLTMSVEGTGVKTKIQPRQKLELLLEEKVRPPRKRLKRLDLVPLAHSNMFTNREFKMRFQDQDYFQNEIFRTLRTRSNSRGKECYENIILCRADINIRIYYNI
jgi:hypothetical protein